MRIHTLILDLGGVVVDLNLERFFSALNALGFDAKEHFFSMKQQAAEIHQFEMGDISEADFLKFFAREIKTEKSMVELKNLWCLMVDGINLDTVNTLAELRKHYTLCALSNTNITHHHFLNAHVQEQYGLANLEALFDKSFFSYQHHTRKPTAECFKIALEQFDTPLENTVFIDDIEENINAARALGLTSLLKPRAESLSSFLIRYQLISPLNTIQ